MMFISVLASTRVFGRAVSAPRRMQRRRGVDPQISQRAQILERMIARSIAAERGETVREVVAGLMGLACSPKTVREGPLWVRPGCPSLIPGGAKSATDDQSALPSLRRFRS
jgi:hypothetical protein